MRFWILLALAGCGRFGFGEISTGDGGGPGDGGPDAVDAVPIDVVVPNLCPNATPLGPGTSPSIAWSGSTYGVAFVNGTDVVLVPISSTGVPQTSHTLYSATSAPAQPTNASIAWTGTMFVVIYAMDGIYGSTTAGDGVPITANTLIDNASTDTGVALATGGGTIRFQYASKIAGYEQFTESVTDTMTSPMYAQLSNSAAASGSLDGSSTWTGTSWGAVWDDTKFQGGCYQHGIYYVQVKSTGALNGSALQIYQASCNATAPSERHRPVVVYNGATLSLAFVGTTSSPTDIVVASLAADSGTVLSGPTVVTSGPGTEVALTWSGSELGLAWISNGVFLTRASVDGLPIAEVTFDSAGTTPALVWDGTHYALVWERGGIIYFARTC